MRSLLLAIGLGLLAQPALAQDVALVIGNDAYRTLDRVEPAAGAGTAAEALSEAGVEVVSAQDADRAGTIAAIREFAQFGREAQGQAAVLIGRFGEVDGDAWFLPVEAPGRDRIDTAEHGVPVALLAQILATAPGRAILLLGAAEPEAVGEVDLPQGVTLAVTDPATAADFVERTLAVPGAALASGLPEDARTGGFLPTGLSFLPEAGAAPEPETDSESDYWRLALLRGEASAYRAYLDRYPEGANAQEARDRIARLTGSSEETPAEAEERMDLNREERQDVQRDLSVLGYDTRGVDGIFGPGTRAAISGWQADNELESTGYLTRDQVARLDETGAERAAVLEEEERRQREERRRESEALWSGMGAERSESELATYLDRFPDGAYAGEARRRLAAIRDSRAVNEGASERERQIWQVTRQQNTEQGYRTYLRAFPEGEFANEARAAIGELENRGPRDTAAAGDEAALGLTRATRRAVEQRLDAMGLNPGQVDGSFDSQTRAALRRYQQSAGLPVTGYVNQITAVRLLSDTIRGVLQ